MLKKFLGVTLGLMLIPSGFATPFGYKDFSNAPAPYVGAEHETGDWQRLGANYTVNDGVSWSIDGGNTFGHEGLTLGESVIFKIDLYSHNIGGHITDPVRAWIDWNADGSWADDEMIFSDKYKKAFNDSGYWVKATPDDPTPSGENEWNGRHWVNGNTGDWIKLEYTFSMLVPQTASVGSTWLRARATCDASLGGEDWQRTWSDWAWEAKEGDINLMASTGWLHQGESEDYLVAIKPKHIHTVPETSSLFLLLLGLPLLVVRKLRVSM